ncbi:MAG: winged helix DNA-binding protein [Spirochaetia bacterium]|nr:winged helix DNA-binding protein [Spirochaetia bacterium]
MPTKRAMESNLGFQVYNLARIYKSYFLSVTHSVQPRFFPEQWIILNQLKAQPVIAQTELLSPFSEGGMAGLTRSLSTMQRRGWIRRAPDRKDRRKVNVALTARGKSIHQQIMEIGREVRPNLNAGISDEMKLLLVEGMNQLEANLMSEISRMRNRSRTHARVR